MAAESTQPVITGGASTGPTGTSPPPPTPAGPTGTNLTTTTTAGPTGTCPTLPI